MKKVLSIILCAVMLSCVFVACSKEEEPEATSAPVSTTKTITTEAAVIKEADAINLIKSYSAKQLGLTKEDYSACSFMVGGSGIQIKDNYYVKVIATIPTKHKNDDGSESYTFDNKGEYYIRYDGKQILKKDMKSAEDKYDEMKVKEVPTTELPTSEKTNDKNKKE